MSGFSPEWLALREPADHRARSMAVAQGLARTFAARERVAVLDLGCGTGSNLRALAAWLPRHQRWRLVDHDEALLAEAGRALRAWADRYAEERGAVVLHWRDREIAVTLSRADLARDLERAFDPAPDLVTAAALFDLASAAWIAALARAAAACKAVFCAALTYDGEGGWTPPHRADGAMKAAFDAHQRRDKGFGPAAGPEAARVLAQALAEAGFRVRAAPSPWALDARDAALIAALAEGYAAAVRETGLVPDEVIADWLAARRAGCRWTVGHRDLLALPA